MTAPLNETQIAFCEAPAGNIRLLAPAGCGKTLSILHRCLHLAKQSPRPRFLIVAFTRAARDELQSRLVENADLAPLRDIAEVATLNSWGFRRIKAATFSPKLISTKDQYHFTVLNQLQPVWQKHEHIKAAIERNKHRAPRVIMDVIDAFKSLGFDHRRHTNYTLFGQHLDYLAGQNLTWRLEEQFDRLTRIGVLETKFTAGGAEVPKAGRQEVHRAFYRFWRDAAEHLIGNATFTLEDQKYFACLDERQKVEQGSFLSGAARYSHVFVDEFQDINPLDLNLIRTIVRRNRADLVVAGDDDQAIFEWRGATPEYVLDPGKFFEVRFESHILDINYRSPANVVSHARRLIEHNRRRVDKKMSAASTRDARIEVERVPDLAHSLDHVCGLIEETVRKGASPAQIAIIGRKRSQLIPYQIQFASKGVSFCAAEDLSLFLSKTFERLLDLIDLKTRDSSRQRPSQVVTDVLQLCDLVKRYPLSKADRESVHGHLQALRPRSLDAALGALSGYRGNLKGANADGQTSMSMAEAIRGFVAADTVTDTLLSLGANFEGLQLDFGKAEADIFYTDPPFSHLAEFAATYGDDHDRFVEDIERAKDQLVYTPPFSDDDPGDSARRPWKRPVHLMTALRAKGKEFHTVVLLDVVDGIWPNRNAATPAEREAERRVFYVAFTRARERIVLFVSDRTGGDKSIVSPYIRELGLNERPSQPRTLVRDSARRPRARPEAKPHRKAS